MAMLPFDVRERGRLRVVVRLGCMLQEQIGDIEDEPTRPAVADGDPLRATQPIEHRKADAVEWHAETRRHFPCMAVGDEQITSAARLLQIVEIADDDARRLVMRDNARTLNERTPV